MMEFARLRKSYDLYGFVRLGNIFEDWQIDSLELAFNQFYLKRLGKHPDSALERLPLLGAALEDPTIAKTIASNPYLISSLRAIAGENCQYLGSDIQLVYDDSIGIHRDTHYSHDMVKILIFLSDCAPALTNVPASCRLSKSAGGFAVLSGSHIPNSIYSSLSSQLSDWPRQELSVRSDLTTEYHRGDIHSNHEFLYPVHTYDTRYQGFSHIPFRRGDVVIFSTRAFHALLPTHTDHYSKLLGLLFIEDFEKSTGRKLNAQVEDMTFDEKEYVTLPFNLRLADNIIKGDDYQTAYKSFANYPMGLQEILASGDPLLAKAFSQHTSIYQFSQAAQLDLFQSCLASKEAVLKTFEKNFHSERDILNRYLQPIDSTMSELATRSAIYTEEITSLASQFLDEMHSTLAASPVLRQSDSNPLAKRLRYKLKQLAKRLLRRS